MVRSHTHDLFYSCSDTRSSAMDIVRLLLKECPYPEVTTQLSVLDTLAGLGLVLKPATLRSESGLGVLKRVVKVNATNYNKPSLGCSEERVSGFARYIGV
eukprot:sb/3478567/